MRHLITHDTNVHQFRDKRATQIDTSAVMFLKLNIIAAVLYISLFCGKFSWKLLLSEITWKKRNRDK